MIVTEGKRNQEGCLRLGSMKMALDEPWVPKVLLLLAVLIYFLGAIDGLLWDMLLHTAKVSHSYWFNKTLTGK